MSIVVAHPFRGEAFPIPSPDRPAHCRRNTLRPKGLSYKTVTKGCLWNAGTESSRTSKAQFSYVRSSLLSRSQSDRLDEERECARENSIARAIRSATVGVSCTNSPRGPSSVRQCSYSPRDGYGPSAGMLTSFSRSIVCAYHARGEPYVSGGTQRSMCQRLTAGYFGSWRSSMTSRSSDPVEVSGRQPLAHRALGAAGNVR